MRTEAYLPAHATLPETRSLLPGNKGEITVDSQPVPRENGSGSGVRRRHHTKTDPVPRRRSVVFARDDKEVRASPVTTETKKDTIPNAEVKRDAIPKAEVKRDIVPEAEVKRDVMPETEVKRDAVVEPKRDVVHDVAKRDAVPVEEVKRNLVAADSKVERDITPTPEVKKDVIAASPEPAKRHNAAVPDTKRDTPTEVKKRGPSSLMATFKRELDSLN